MKHLKPMMIAFLCLILVLPACAEARLQARLEGDTVVVGWTPTTCDACVLTVYRDSWPVSVTTVDGASGAASVPVGRGGGHYTVRLNLDGACLTADVDSEYRSTPQPTAAPTEVPSIAPTAVPTEIPTVASTETPTAIPTAAPTENPTVAPTEAPTAIPTAIPTAKPTGVPAPSGSSRGDLAGEVIAQVNAERARAGLSPLTHSSELTRAACVRAQEIVQAFSHTRPDGRSWSTVSGAAYGENIAKGQNTADKVMAAWMSSEGHRANILRSSYGSIGVCAWVSGGVVYWVQLFGQ